MTTRAELDARYGVALEALQIAAKAKAPDLEECGLELQRLKIKLRESKRRLMERVEKPEWNSYPAPMDLPRSAEDERFVQSFGVDNAAAATAFYDKYGFVIFDDILDADECAATTAEIWSYLEEQHPGLQRDDEGTWEVLSAVRYGLPEAQAIFTPQVVANRQNQRLYAALDAILPRMPDSPGEFDSPHPDPNSIVMSQDRWCVYRPTIKNPDWKTAENLHLDVNPWTYAGLNPSEIETLSYSATESGGERFPLRDFRIEMTAVQGAPRSTGAQALLAQARSPFPINSVVTCPHSASFRQAPDQAMLAFAPKTLLFAGRSRLDDDALSTRCPSEIDAEVFSARGELPRRPLLSDGFTRLSPESRLSTQPPPAPNRTIPDYEPMKVQLRAEARSLPTLGLGVGGLDPRLPAKKMPTFADEFGPANSADLDPELPAKKRVPDYLLDEICSGHRPAAR